MTLFGVMSFTNLFQAENGLTGEQAQQIGLEYARKNFPGHQALVCTHMDGHNESGNIHVHIVINSLRKIDVERQDFMERPCDSRAGYKHHVSKDYLTHLKQSLMDICHREHLHQVDLLAPAEKKITDREYRAKHRGQKKLDERNSQILAGGLTPRKTVFQTQKEFLRNAIEEAAASTCDLEEFQRLLLEKYSITLKVNRGRFSYLHPERTKFITGRMLGTHYEMNYLLKLFAENVKEHENKDEQIIPGRYDTEVKLSTYRQPEPAYDESIAILFVKSDLHLVINLQECVKAQQNAVYANKVKLSNLKEMAKTVAYIQEHGYDTREALENSSSEIKSHASSSRKELKSIEGRLWQMNEQIYYTGQYLANKSVYQQFCKSKFKRQFRKEHSAEIALYETARKFLKEHSSHGRLPSMKLLKVEKEQLLQQKKETQKTYRYYQDYKKELITARSNVDAILGQTQSKQAEKQKNMQTLL